MGDGISAVLTFAVGVAISPVPIIAVILMLFSQRARVNGPMFLLGWALALSAISAVAYWLADHGEASTSSATIDTIAWGKIIFGVLFLLLAARSWRKRPAPGVAPETPKWMAGIDALSPAKALGLGLLLSGLNPKNLMLTLGAGASLAQLGLPTSQAVGSLVVFVILGSLTIAGPVIYSLLGGERSEARLTETKTWLTVHNGAVMMVLFVVLGVDLIAKGLPPIT